MNTDQRWYEEEWATDLFADIAKSVFAPKTKETQTVSPQLGATVKMSDWTVAGIVLGVVGLILLVVFLKMR